MSSERFNTELLKIKGFTENPDGTFSKKKPTFSEQLFKKADEVYQKQAEQVWMIEGGHTKDHKVNILGQRTLYITPCPAPRMTVSDKWKTVDNKNEKYRQRPCVTRYFAFKDAFLSECKRVGYTLGNEVNIEFYLPMPKTWSKKKKLEMDGKPHQQKPDVDNISKSFFDAFGADDSFVWSLTAKKFWSFEGKIIINQ